MKSKTKMITTNIRLSKPDWLQTKAIAAQLGMSLNQYVTKILIQANKNKTLAQKNDSKKEDVIWSLNEIAPDENLYKPEEMSIDDRDIYQH